MLELKQTSDGVLLPVKVQPKARLNGITGTHNKRLKVSVAEAPEKGKANAAIVKLLAKSLGVSKSDVQLVKGATSAQKSFLLRGQRVTDLVATLNAIGIRS